MDETPTLHIRSHDHEPGEILAVDQTHGFILVIKHHDVVDAVLAEGVEHFDVERDRPQNQVVGDDSLGNGGILADAEREPSETMTIPRLIFVSTLSLSLCFSSHAGGAPSDAPKPASRTERVIEGWTVRIDDRLLQEENRELGGRILKSLERRLADIKAVVRPLRLEQLQKVRIVLDMSHGKLKPMQYHPEADWLKENGYAVDLARCVHIPVAANLLDARQINTQPWVILHELAHAFHDQVLGFEEARVLEVFKLYKDSGHGEQALLITGKKVRHYGLTDQKEFFSEMTEAYFGSNDFFPFNRAELMTVEPEIYELMKNIWGPHRYDEKP